MDVVDGSHTFDPQLIYMERFALAHMLFELLDMLLCTHAVEESGQGIVVDEIALYINEDK